MLWRWLVRLRCLNRPSVDRSSSMKRLQNRALVKVLYSCVFATLRKRHCRVKSEFKKQARRINFISASQWLVIMTKSPVRRYCCIKMANGNGVENLQLPVTDTFVPQNIRAFIETVNYFLQTTSASLKKVSFSVENESSSVENEQHSILLRMIT